MSNLSYWERRQIEDMYRYMQSAEDCADQISKLYRKASRYLSLQADGIFERFQTKHKLSDAEARALLNVIQDRTSLDELIVVPQIKRNSILHIIRDCFCDVSMNNSRLFDADSALYFI